MTAPRERLLAAAPSLWSQFSFQELTEARIVSAAGVGTDEFQAAFGSIFGYVNVLQQQFMDELRNRILKVTTGTGSGMTRIQLACETYLSGCLDHRALRAWLIEARTLPEVAAGLRKQNQVYWVVLGSELKTLGWPQPQAAARLFLAMINEAATIEHRAGGPVPAARESLWDFLLRGTAKAAAERATASPARKS